MTGEEVTPPVMEILRNDFMRFCSIDIETDSTVEADEATEKEANAQIMQVIGGTMRRVRACFSQACCRRRWSSTSCSK